MEDRAGCVEGRSAVSSLHITLQERRREGEKEFDSRRVEIKEKEVVMDQIRLFIGIAGVVKVLQSVCIRTFFFLCVVFEGTMNSLSASAPPPSPDTLLGV